MKNVAFIPVRGGSKSIKGKNILPLKGFPLVYYSAKAAQDSKFVEKIFISTDSVEIKKVCESFKFSKLEVISRSVETATDTATSESALIEFCENYDFKNVVFLQATSPLTQTSDIDTAFEKYEKSGKKSLISAVKRFQFLWNTDGTPMNYNPQMRPRRQDWEGYYIENGAFYISNRADILKNKCRITYPVAFYNMPQETLFEVDEKEDWEIIEKFLK